ncbi:MAG: ornithine cyclodeaminase family protein [Candidatus Aminicenantes bacterium]|nr:ornithine cyclodeaminase family protein [Candidatus Aminicenantes bacterium]
MSGAPATRPPLLYLGAEDVRRALPMRAAVEAMREAFRDLANGAVAMPPRTRMANPEGDEVSLIMSSRSNGISRLGVKLITLYDRNRTIGLPLAQALFMLVDGQTGVPLAIFDGASLTALRTGAVSGLATDVLARPGGAVAAIFGAGVQARAQLEAIAAVRPIREARVFDPIAPAAEAFAAEMSGRLSVLVHPASDPAAMLQGADIVCTATNSRTPLFADGDIAPGTHINAVGVYQPERAEIPAETVRRARTVVDQTGAALEEAGDLLQPLAAGMIDRSRFDLTLGDILIGRAEGRRSPAEITLFKSVGLAVQDLYAAARAYDNALRLGVGRELER